MYVYYVTMEWPVRSEVFAVNDIKALCARSDIKFKIAGLKPLGNQKRESLSFLDVKNIPSFNITARDLIAGAWEALRSPQRTYALIRKIYENEPRRDQRLKTWALIPSAYAVYRDIVREQPDILHLFWGHYPSLVAWLLLQDPAHPKITMFLGAYDLRLRLGLSKELARHPEIKIATHAHMNVADIASWTGCANDKIFVIHRGINLEPVENRTATMPERLRLIFAGRLMAEKGTRELLDVASQLKSRQTDFILTIVGDGPDRESMMAEVDRLGLSQNVLFKGWMEQKALAAEFKSSDILVFPSHKECLPNVVKEAMAAGCLPVASPTTAIDELIENGKNGWVTSSLSVPDIMAAIDQAIAIGQDASRYDAILKAARDKIERDFSCDRNMKAYCDVWASLLKTPSLLSSDPR